MTYTQAKLIVHNPRAYSLKERSQAAVFILGTLGASHEDIIAAEYAI